MAHREIGCSRRTPENDIQDTGFLHILQLSHPPVAPVQCGFAQPGNHRHAVEVMQRCFRLKRGVRLWQRRWCWRCQIWQRLGCCGGAGLLAQIVAHDIRIPAWLWLDSRLLNFLRGNRSGEEQGHEGEGCFMHVWAHHGKDGWPSRHPREVQTD